MEELHFIPWTEAQCHGEVERERRKRGGPAISLGGEGGYKHVAGPGAARTVYPHASGPPVALFAVFARQSQSPPKIRRRELLSQPPLSARECLSCLRASSADFPDPDRPCRLTRRATTRIRQANLSRCLLLQLDAVPRWSGRACRRRGD